MYQDGAADAPARWCYVSPMRVVAADVGGTKTLIALYEGEPGAFTEVARRRYESTDYEGVVPILRDFLGASESAVDAAALGVAGPVVNDTCRATNLPWHLDARRIERELGVARVRLLNDFEAVALGIGELPEQALDVLQDRPLEPGWQAAVLGAGTGLGEAILLPPIAGALPRVSPTEGGHADFAPRDETEIALLRFLMRRHGRVSIERVLSGRGLEAIYELLVAEGIATSAPDVAARIAGSDDRAAVIGQLGSAGADPACARAVSLFVSIYGSEAGNFALKTLPFGGLYVAGGIAPKLIEAIRGGEFLRAFRVKPPMEPVLDRIRVSVVLDPSVGLLGARRVALGLASAV